MRFDKSMQYELDTRSLPKMLSDTLDEAVAAFLRFDHDCWSNTSIHHAMKNKTN